MALTPDFHGKLNGKKDTREHIFLNIHVIQCHVSFSFIHAGK